MKELTKYLSEVQGRVDATNGNDLDSWVDFEEHARQDVEVLLEMVKKLVDALIEIKGKGEDESEYLASEALAEWEKQ